ncbi:TPA: hypothetical protein TXV04_001927 [Streptococcus suis]|uniref:hypothetical protein n=1 Tax=Streptococcus suis TaxID=1307 RepID=UPI000C18CDBC|nr:hypothetical protein [Streptococcus suis]HEL1768780.1 hypothetical protein [Streptococcus suis]HEL9637538.1 hypothetical protein [Streptococcus suis]
MKKIVLRSALLLSIISPIVTTTTLSVNAETSLRVAAIPRSYYLNKRFFVISNLTQTRYHEEFRNGVKYSGYLRLTDYQKTSDGYYLAYYAGTISR